MADFFDSFTKRLLYFGFGSIGLEANATVLHHRYTILKDAIEQANATESVDIKLPIEIAEELLQDCYDAADCKGKYCSCQEELDSLQGKLKEAREYYLNSGKRTEKRNSQIVQNLGISTGVRQARIDKKVLYREYYELVIEKEVAREMAVCNLTEKYDILSEDACIAHLQQYCSLVRKDFEDRGHSSAHLDHFIPARSPS